MRRVSTTTRISIALTALSVSILLIAHAMGFVPDALDASLQGRKALCEAIALHSSSAVFRGVQSRSQPLAVLRSLGFEIREIDAAVSRACDDDDAHSGHHRARRIGAVRGCGNQAHVACLVTSFAMVGANHHQAGKLALRS